VFALLILAATTVGSERKTSRDAFDTNLFIKISNNPMFRGVYSNENTYLCSRITDRLIATEVARENAKNGLWRCRRNKHVETVPQSERENHDENLDRLFSLNN
jgi:hypothetical protein